MARREADLATAYKAWKKLLGKCNACCIKVLRSLAEDDCREAADTLGEKARPPVPTRCGHCPGCLTFQSEKACKLCPGCQTNQGCEERTRLCFDWPLVSNYFQLGSTVTGVSLDSTSPPPTSPSTETRWIYWSMPVPTWTSLWLDTR